MQGFGTKKYDLPTPYGLKPRRGHKSLKKMDRVARNYFTTPQRKLLGYIVLLVLTGLFIFQVVPLLQSDDSNPTAYEIDGGSDAGIVPESPKSPDLSGIVNPKENIHEKKNVVDLGNIEIEES